MFPGVFSRYFLDFSFCCYFVFAWFFFGGAGLVAAESSDFSSSIALRDHLLSSVCRSLNQSIVSGDLSHCDFSIAGLSQSVLSESVICDPTQSSCSVVADDNVSSCILSKLLTDCHHCHDLWSLHLKISSKWIPFHLDFEISKKKFYSNLLDICLHNLYLSNIIPYRLGLVHSDVDASVASRYVRGLKAPVGVRGRFDLVDSIEHCDVTSSCFGRRKKDSSVKSNYFNF